MALERQISDKVYLGFFEHGSRLDLNYSRDVEDKRRLMAGSLPLNGDVYRISPHDVGVMFKEFMEGAREAVYRNATSERLYSMLLVALSNFPGLSEGKNPTAQDLKGKLRALRNMGYPIKDSIGKMRKDVAFEALELAKTRMKKDLENKNPEYLDELVERFER